MEVISCILYSGHSRLIIAGYIDYVINHYGSSSILVFDGYSTVSTKATEQLRRTKKSTSSDIFFDQNMQTTTSQAAFLTNNHNKKRLIVIIKQVGIQV